MTTPLTAQQLIERAHELAPLLRDKARDAEIARRPLDEVIDAVRDSGLFALMVPKSLGGHELDLDTFFEVGLILSEADASMGWLITFYIEHNYWFLHYPEAVCTEVFDGNNYALAPGALSMAGGQASPVEGGYQLRGQWQWGTGIVHGTWVMAGALVVEDDKAPTPMFFLLPRDEVEAIDTWFTTGMCGTGSWDFKIDDVFVPSARALPWIDLLYVQTGIEQRFDGPLYRTPLMPILAITATLPILGAAKMVVKEFSAQVEAKIAKQQLRGGAAFEQFDVSSVIGEAALQVEAAELLARNVLADVLANRATASVEERAGWLSRLAHAVYTCKDAVGKIGAESGASGGMLHNPVQRGIRDIGIATNHIVFAKHARYGDFGRTLTGQKIKNLGV